MFLLRSTKDTENKLQKFTLLTLVALSSIEQMIRLCKSTDSSIKRAHWFKEDNRISPLRRIHVNINYKIITFFIFTTFFLSYIHILINSFSTTCSCCSNYSSKQSMYLVIMSLIDHINDEDGTEAHKIHIHKKQ